MSSLNHVHPLFFLACHYFCKISEGWFWSFLYKTAHMLNALYSMKMNDDFAYIEERSNEPLQHYIKMNESLDPGILPSQAAIVTSKLSNLAWNRAHLPMRHMMAGLMWLKLSTQSKHSITWLSLLCCCRHSICR